MFGNFFFIKKTRIPKSITAKNNRKKTTNKFFIPKATKLGKYTTYILICEY